MDSNSFDTDLKIGERAERFLLEKLREEFPTLKKIEGYNPEYDLIDDNGYSFEVKLDMRSKTSGNVGIEYRHNGQPSAISTSKAMEWVIIYYFNTWRYTRIKTTLLRAFIKNNWEYFAKFSGKGDKSSLVLIPTKEFEDYFFCSDINYYKPLDNTLGGV